MHARNLRVIIIEHITCATALVMLLQAKRGGLKDTDAVDLPPSSCTQTADVSHALHLPSLLSCSGRQSVAGSRTLMQ
jgi:hypothetical protein